MTSIHSFLVLLSLFLHVVLAIPANYPDTNSSSNSNQSCGGFYEEDMGIVESPHFPSYYGEGLNCDYIFHAPEGHYVHVEFLVFDVDEEENENNCVFDRVHLHDGPNSTYPALGKAMCGEKKPASVSSSGRYLTLHFHSGDDSAFGKGFQLSYYMVKDTQKAKKCLTNVCGGQFENFVGCEIQSPNYPFEYLPNQDCTWIMHAPNPNDRFKIEFKSLKLEASLFCSKNNVTLRDGKDESDKVIRKILCKAKDVSSKYVFETTGPYLRMEYKTQNETLEERESRTYGMDHLTGLAVHVILIPGPTDPTKTVISTTTKSTTPKTSEEPKSTLSTLDTKITSTKSKTQSQASDGAAVTEKVNTVEKTTSLKEANKNSASKIPASAMSGLVIGVIVGLLVVVLLILTVVAFVHWKRQNYRIRLRTEDDHNVLITNMDGDDAEVNLRKSNSNGRIVRQQNRDSLNNDQL